MCVPPSNSSPLRAALGELPSGHRGVRTASTTASIEEVRERIGTRAMTPDESEKFWREHGPLMQPSDGEG